MVDAICKEQTFVRKPHVMRFDVQKVNEKRQGHLCLATDIRLQKQKNDCTTTKQSDIMNCLHVQYIFMNIYLKNTKKKQHALA